MLPDVIARSLSVIFERSWQLGEVLEGYRKENVTPVFKRGEKEDPGKTSFTSVSGKEMK